MTITSVLLLIVTIIVFIGFIRVVFSPYTGFLNFLMELMLMDWMSEILVSLFSAIGDSFSDSDWD